MKIPETSDEIQELMDKKEKEQQEQERALKIVEDEIGLIELNMSKERVRLLELKSPKEKAQQNIKEISRDLRILNRAYWRISKQGN